MKTAKENRKQLDMEQLGKVHGGYSWDEFVLGLKAVWQDYADAVCENVDEHPFGEHTLGF